MEISKRVSTSLDEWILLPGLTKAEKEADLATNIAGIKLKTVLMSAAMQAVTGSKTAIALAEEGGIGIIFAKQSIDNEAKMVKEVKDKNLTVGAAINTRDYRLRTDALAKAGADLIVIDSSDGFSEYQKRTIKYIKENYKIPVIGGNVVTKEGLEFLADAGADAIKIGMGIGAICKTQQVKGVGRGQATALMECAKARDKIKNRYVPIIADGGIRNARNTLTALALGADAVMMGYFFAGFDEGPTEITVKDGKKYKPYWGEASERAQNWERYAENKSDFVEEGFEMLVPYTGFLKQGVEKITTTIKMAMKNIGTYSIKELHKNARLEYMSEAAMKEGKIRQ